MAKSYRLVDRDQHFLLPTDMSHWLSADHFVWFLIDMVDELDMSTFEAVGRRAGWASRLMIRWSVGLWDATGQRSSRRIEDLCHTEVAYRVLCAQDLPDHSTIARFHQAHHDAVADLFTQVLVLAGKAGLGRFGIVAIDGTKIAANASVGANRKRSWLREQVDQMMDEASQTDAAEDHLFGVDVSGTELDPGLAERATRKKRIRAALKAADEAAQKAAAADGSKVDRWGKRIEVAERHLEDERAKSAHKFDAFQARKARAQLEGTAKPTGVFPESAEEYRSVAAAKKRLADNQKRQDDARTAAVDRAAQRKEPRANPTDPDCGPMPTSGGWIQGYNAQLAVSDDQLILAA